MAAIRGANTKPELRVRRLLHSLGYRFRIHLKGMPGRPDLAFPRRGKAIFVHGCFWHGHESCGAARVPKTRTGFWRNKLDANKVRDAKYIRALADLGWESLVVWECELSDAESLERRLCSFLGPPRILDLQRGG